MYFIYDHSLNLDGFSTSGQNKFLQYQNISFWNNLTSDQRKYHRRVLNGYIEKYSDLLGFKVYRKISDKLRLILF